LNVLVVDRSPPLDLRQGNELIAANVFPRLLDVDTVLVAPSDGDLVAERAALRDVFGEVHLVARRRRMPALAGAVEPGLARRLGRTSMVGRAGMDLPATRDLVRTIDGLLRSRAWDVIHIRQLPMAAHVSPAPVGRLLELVDAETLASSRRAGMRARVRGVAARALERRAVATADLVTVVSPVDAAAIRDLGTRIRVEVVTNGVDTDRFDPATVGPVPAIVESIAFVGAMSFPPNIEAAVWLCREVLPILRRQRPGARVRLIGRDPSPAVRALAGDAVDVTGTVDDVRPEILRSPIVAVPMVSGSGVKNKVLEAMSLARPIVSTTLGIESLDVQDDEHLVIADGAAAFAGALDRLLDDPARQARLGAAARMMVVRDLSWEACAGRYRELYEDLAEVTRGRRDR